ncbi:helix-turn-helix domain-containing protein [Croceivirga radicis]|uniref:helix-turn-helix domain-containing protein n=1 Tax=Croceivirga radicis TaxID=1929488 RepID=UPI000497B86E|nr:helix-turn-helix domain-containing protein [Croceivirga radicis]
MKMGLFLKVFYQLLFPIFEIELKTTTCLLTTLNTNPYGSPSIKIDGNALATDVLNYFFLVCALNGFAFGIWLLVKYFKSKEDTTIFLSLVLISCASIVLELFMFSWDGIAYNPRIPFFRVNILGFTPLLFLYINRRFYKQINCKSKFCLLHFSPFLIALMGFSWVLLARESYITQEITSVLNNVWLRSLYVAIYLGLLIYNFFRLRIQIERKDIKLLLALIGTLFIIWIFLSLKAELQYNLNYAITINLIASLFLSCFLILLIGQLFMNASHVLDNKVGLQVTKYKNSPLTKDMAIDLKTKLINSMEVEKLYLDSNLNLQTLAEKLDTDRYSISQVINENFNKNFYEFVNDYRISYAKTMLENKINQDIVISDIVFQVGFNNKVSFYKAFKKRLNKTPLEYHKTL